MSVPTPRPWLHAVEADFARDSARDENEVEQTEREDAEHREPAMTDWWEGNDAA